MPAGRPAKLTSLHKLQGTFRPARHAHRAALEPVAVGDLDPVPPVGFTEAEAKIWSYCLQHAPAGVLKAIDRATLTIYVTASARHAIASAAQQAQDRQRKRDGLTPLLVTNAAGNTVVSPLLAILNAAAGMMLKAGAELGFTPASRPKLAGRAGKVTSAPVASEWDLLDS